MRWKRGDVVWSNMTLRELVVSILSTCFVLGVFGWFVFGVILSPSAPAAAGVTSADTILVMIWCAAAGAAVTGLIDFFS